MKRFTKKAKASAETLADVQSNIARLKRKLAALQAQEAELLGDVTPAFDGLQESAKQVVHCVRGDVLVTYTFVSRSVVDLDKTEALLARLGKKMPRRQEEFAYVKVRRLTPE